MQPIPANQLLAGLTLAEPIPIHAVVTDSRRVEPGCVFICFPGERVDGHTFAAGAYRDGAAYVVSGASMDNLIRSVNFENEDSLNYFHRMLRKWGVIDALREAGAQEGDSVVIGEMEFDFVE